MLQDLESGEQPLVPSKSSVPRASDPYQVPLSLEPSQDAALTLQMREAELKSLYQLCIQRLSRVSAVLMHQVLAVLTDVEEEGEAMGWELGTPTSCPCFLPHSHAGTTLH